MSLVLVLLYAVAIFLSLALWFSRRAWSKMLAGGRGRFALGLAGLSVLITAPFWIASQGAFVALPVAVLVFDIGLLSALYRFWLADRMQDVSLGLIGGDTRLEVQFRANPLLRRLMKDKE
jgi:hypothetical protein